MYSGKRNEMVENLLPLTHLDNNSSGNSPSRARTPEPCTERTGWGLLPLL